MFQHACTILMIVLIPYQVENPKVKLRLAIFQMVPLPKVDRSIAFEIENRSLDAVIYVALELLRNWDLVPKEETYFRQPAPLEPEFDKLQRAKICQNVVGLSMIA